MLILRQWLKLGCAPLGVVGDALEGIASSLDPVQEGVQGNIVIPVGIYCMVEATAAPLCRCNTRNALCHKVHRPAREVQDHFMPCLTASVVHLRRRCRPYQMICSLHMPGRIRRLHCSACRHLCAFRRVTRAVSIECITFAASNAVAKYAKSDKERQRSEGLHAIIVPIWAIGVFVEGLWGHSCVDKTGKQPCKHVCRILLTQVPASRIIDCQRHVPGMFACAFEYNYGF